MPKECNLCGKYSSILNSNNHCPDCVFSLKTPEDESKIFTGELHGGYCECGKCVSCIHRKEIFKEIPTCLKCDKPIEKYGLVYMIEHACSRFIYASCHGEIEIKMLNESPISKLDEQLKQFFG
jgi:hypothetical protein